MDNVPRGGPFFVNWKFFTSEIFQIWVLRRETLQDFYEGSRQVDTGCTVFIVKSL